jgi:hypothetical protein
MGSVVSKEKSTCSICLDCVDTKKKTLSCQHTFHEGCIDTWFKYKTSCPLCRKTTDTESVTLHIDWIREGETWRRRIRVTPELSWNPADGPMPDSLRSWRERHSL